MNHELASTGCFQPCVANCEAQAEPSTGRGSWVKDESDPLRTQGLRSAILNPACQLWGISENGNPRSSALPWQNRMTPAARGAGSLATRSGRHGRFPKVQDLEELLWSLSMARNRQGSTIPRISNSEPCPQHAGQAKRKGCPRQTCKDSCRSAQKTNRSLNRFLLELCQIPGYCWGIDVQ